MRRGTVVAITVVSTLAVVGGLAAGSSSTVRVPADAQGKTVYVYDSNGAADG